MKRTPLSRTTPLRRVGITRTNKPRRHSDPTVVEQFVSEHAFCWRCGTSKGKLDVHHISRTRRWDVRENLARLCRSCHDVHHFGFGFDVDAVCELKSQFDAAWYSPATLRDLIRPGRRGK